MEIKIKKTVEDTIEITLPKFWKNIRIGGIELLGAIDENNVILMSIDERYWQVRNFSAWVMDSQIATAANEWEEISETQFLDTYTLELRKLTLTPICNEPR